MDQKVSKTDEIRRINNRLKEIMESASSTTNSAINAISSLQNNIKGNGVKTTLDLLKDAINNNNNIILDVIFKMSKYTLQQMGSYDQANKTVESDLTAAKNIIDAIKVESVGE